MRVRPSIAVLAAVAALAAATGVPRADGDRPLPGVAFDQEGPLVTAEGHATLSWAVTGAERAVPGRQFELQDADREDFADAHMWYSGPDRASFVSGLPAGTTWFRVRVVDGERAGAWSAPIAIEVRYASRVELFRLLTLGAIVFVATVATVVIGHRRRDVPAR